MTKISLEMREVTKTFGTGHTTVEALKGANFKVHPGEFVSVIGPSGSGKSTFLTIAGGLQTPTSGQILVNEKDISHLSEKKRSMLRLKEIGFILQSTNLIPFLTIEEQFRFIDKVEKRTFQKEKCFALLKNLDIFALKDKLPRALSGGEKQRAVIGTSLYNDPTVILADEPTAALDTEHAYEVVQLLAKEAKEKQKAIIMVTHDPRMVVFSDAVYKMSDGQLLKEINEKKAS